MIDTTKQYNFTCNLCGQGFDYGKARVGLSIPEYCSDKCRRQADAPKCEHDNCYYCCYLCNS